MAIRGLSAFRPRKNRWRILVVLSLFAIFQVAAAEESRDENPDQTTPSNDANENSMQQIRIKRLKPADPESTEVMLAARGCECRATPV